MQFMTINNRTQFVNAKDVTNARTDNNFKMRRPRLTITSTANLLVFGYRLLYYNNLFTYTQCSARRYHKHIGII